MLEMAAAYDKAGLGALTPRGAGGAGGISLDGGCQLSATHPIRGGAGVGFADPGRSGVANYTYHSNNDDDDSASLAAAAATAAVPSASPSRGLATYGARKYYGSGGGGGGLGTHEGVHHGHGQTAGGSGGGVWSDDAGSGLGLSAMSASRSAFEAVASESGTHAPLMGLRSDGALGSGRQLSAKRPIGGENEHAGSYAPPDPTLTSGAHWSRHQLDDRRSGPRDQSQAPALSPMPASQHPTPQLVATSEALRAPAEAGRRNAGMSTTAAPLVSNARGPSASRGGYGTAATPTTSAAAAAASAGKAPLFPSSTAKASASTAVPHASGSYAAIAAAAAAAAAATAAEAAAAADSAGGSVDSGNLDRGYDDEPTDDDDDDDDDGDDGADGTYYPYQRLGDEDEDGGGSPVISAGPAISPRPTPLGAPAPTAVAGGRHAMHATGRPSAAAAAGAVAASSTSLGTAGGPGDLGGGGGGGMVGGGHNFKSSMAAAAAAAAAASAGMVDEEDEDEEEEERQRTWMQETAMAMRKRMKADEV